MITLDIKTYQEIQQLKKENEALLDMLYKANTELEKRDSIKELMLQFKERLGE